MTAHVEALPISAIIPTNLRAGFLRRTLESMAAQRQQPREIVICSASEDSETQLWCEQKYDGSSGFQVRWLRASTLGAAAQRDEAFAHASQPHILFMDDDILLEPECLPRLWSALQSDPKLGGVNSMITNQSYAPPGRLSRRVFQFLHGRAQPSYAGHWLGGALNLLPEDRPDLPEVVHVQWLNTTCTLYRREALPSPLFPEWFQGYSLGEDHHLSLEVQRRGWTVANARTARIFHDSQPGSHKNKLWKFNAMEVENGWRIGRKFSGLSPLRLMVNLCAVQLLKMLSSLGQLSQWPRTGARIVGNFVGWWRVLTGPRRHLSGTPGVKP